MTSVKSRRTAIVCILTFEVILVILYAIFVKYHHNADSSTPRAQLEFNDLDANYSSKYLFLKPLSELLIYSKGRKN